MSVLPHRIGLGYEGPRKKVKRSGLSTDNEKAAVLASMTSDERAEYAAKNAGSDVKAQLQAARRSRAADLFQLQTEIGNLRKQASTLKKVRWQALT